jgi:uncharacterized cupredoxin-like copper-binding protein
MFSKKLLGPVAGIMATVAIIGCSSSDSKDNASTATTSPNTPAAQASAAPATSAATTAAASATRTATTAAVATTAPAATAAAQTIDLKAGERGANDYYFDPKELTAQPGKVTFRLNDVGPDRPHTFVLKDASGQEVARINRTEVGQTGTVEVTLNTEGTYQFMCMLPGHADRGQTGTLTVKKA